jgi:hypothetical protein
MGAGDQEQPEVLLSSWVPFYKHQALWGTSAASERSSLIWEVRRLVPGHLAKK